MDLKDDSELVHIDASMYELYTWGDPSVGLQASPTNLGHPDLLGLHHMVRISAAGALQGPLLGV